MCPSVANLTFLNYWSCGGSYERGFESIDDRLTRGGPLALKPASHQISLNSSTDFSKPYTGRASARWEWDGAGREEASYSLNLGIKPSSTWELSLGPRLSINHAVAQYVGEVDDPLADATYGTRYLFAGLDQTTLSMETRLNVTFTPDLTLEIFAQPFIANGDYGTIKELRAPRTYDFLRYGIDVGEISTDADGDYLGAIRTDLVQPNRSPWGIPTSTGSPFVARGSSMGVATRIHLLPGLAAESSRLLRRRQFRFPARCGSHVSSQSRQRLHGEGHLLDWRLTPGETGSGQGEVTRRLAVGVEDRRWREDERRPEEFLRPSL